MILQVQILDLTQKKRTVLWHAERDCNTPREASWFRAEWERFAVSKGLGADAVYMTTAEGNLFFTESGVEALTPDDEEPLFI